LLRTSRVGEGPLVAAIVAALLVGVTAHPSVSRAQVPADLTVTVLVRALAYDRDIAGENGPLRVAVVGEGDRASHLAAALAELAEEVSLAGRRLEVLRLEPMPPSAALRELRSAGVGVLLFTAGGARERRSLLNAFGAGGGMVLCDTLRPGCMLAVERSGSRPRIVVDLPSVRRAQRRLDARLLRVADVRR